MASTRRKDRPIDRVVARAAAIALAAVMLTLVAFARVPEPVAVTRDAQAAADVVALMRAGEGAVYVVEFRYARVLRNGNRLPYTMHEARDRAVFAARSSTTLTIDLPRGSYDCELVGDQSQCATRPPVTGLAPSEVLRVAVAAGAYDVTQAVGTTIADEDARCFDVRAHVSNRQLSALGVETDLCFARDGVPLRRRVFSDHLDEWEAARVDRHFDAASLRSVLVGFEKAAPALSQ